MGSAKNMIKKEKDYIKEGERDEEMVPASAAGKLKYLTFSAGAVVFLSIAANMLVAFFRTWRLWKYFKG